MTEWRMHGILNETCYATPVCPAFFLSPFCEDFCQGIISVDLLEGSTYNGVDLTGTKHVIAFHIGTKYHHDKFGKSPALFYIPENVTDEQFKAIEAIERELWEPNYGAVEAVKRAPITYEKETYGDTPAAKRLLVDIPGILHTESQAFVDEDGIPTIIKHGPGFAGTTYIGRAPNSVFRDPDASFGWETHDRDSSACYFEFDIRQGEGLWQPIKD